MSARVGTIVSHCVDYAITDDERFLSATIDRLAPELFVALDIVGIDFARERGGHGTV